ncbi:hypothetical protein [Methyloterricola oryzae]|uniref:hypothetical protein n=1 Tax=Methyloterricola oryzae TaxID=1495050 RepID=UPI00069B6B9A|nr:hypothetical protein [Methyloterricola oryzae]
MSEPDEACCAIIMTDVDLKSHFRSCLDLAIAKNRVAINDATVGYLVSLLVHFNHPENLFETMPDRLVETPLAAMFSQATQARSPIQRNRALQRLGDVALLVAGVFSGGLSRKLIDVDYFVVVGKAAYGRLSEHSRRPPQSLIFRGIFEELSRKFLALVDVFADVAEQNRLAAPDDPLRLYEIWARTGSPRNARKLQELGYTPMRCRNSSHPH